jgi:hypothetical protein
MANLFIVCKWVGNGLLKIARAKRRINMIWSKLSRISYMFPSEVAGAAEFFEQLTALLGRDPHSMVYEDLILLTPSNPQGAVPETSFELAEIAIPKLVLETDLPVDTRIANFYIHGSEVAVDTPSIELEPTGMDLTLLPLSEFVARFEGTLRLDHSGLNVPKRMYAEEDWQALLRDLSTIADVYQYPGEEDWYFLLPATPDEAGGGITQFVTGRTPKFELVYDAHSPLPVVQFQVETELSQAEVEERLPDPYGISFPDLGEIFRTVYIKHPWSGLLIRFDVAFDRPGAANDWKTGEWLVKQGRRMVYAAPKSNTLR